MTDLDLTPSPRILEVLGEVDLRPWQAVAELVDNSFDDFMRGVHPGLSPGIVQITLEAAADDMWLHVKDNGSGMTQAQLESALKAGYSSKDRQGSLGLFGVGFNVATAWLGLVTKVVTRTVQDNGIARSVTIDIRGMQQQDSFKVPVEVAEFPLNAPTGTCISVKLNKEMQATLSRTRAIKDIRDQLGKIYSYILRGDVPGISEYVHSQQNIELTIQGEQVRPRIPCIWDESRSVTRYNRTIKSVQYVNRPLKDAIVCFSCGTWHQSNHLGCCASCGSDRLHAHHREIKGWLGVQRYLDGSDYGIDLLRNGRVILPKYKGFFVWNDQDTGVRVNEYPIEMPATRGRLVGEIHIDHVEVNILKDNFDQHTKDWRIVVETLRGEGKLEGKLNRRNLDQDETVSPLTLLYAGFRRNDPGLNYLTPGDGEKANHTAAVNWGQKFHSGEPTYLTDEKWYEAAALHDRKDTDAEAEEEIIDIDVALPQVGQTVKATPKDSHQPRSVRETMAEVIERLEIGGRKRPEFCAIIHVPSVPGNWNVELWSTSEPFDLTTKNQQPTKSFVEKGSSVKCFVYAKHPLFVEFQRSINDAGLFEIASCLSLQAVKKPSVVEVFYEVLANYGDERVSRGIIIDKINDLTLRLNRVMLRHVSQDPNFWWEIMLPEIQGRLENNAATIFPGTPWQELLRVGLFVDCFDCFCYGKLVRDWPQQMLDGFVFNPTWSGFADDHARHSALEPLARALEFLSQFADDTRLPTAYDNAQAALYISLINDNMVSDYE